MGGIPFLYLDTTLKENAHRLSALVFVRRNIMLGALSLLA